MKQTLILTALLASLLAIASTNLVAQEPQVKLGLSGYCPVCLSNMKQWVKGKPEHEVVFDGRVYRFPGEETKQKFLADPNKYAPVLGGDCTVCLAKMGKRVPGTVQYGAFHKGRTFLFPGEKQRKMFLASPNEFARVDLALSGNCAVCKAKMGKDVPGNPEYTVVYQGLRYLFPGEDQAKMFRANPAKFAVSEKMTGSGSSTRSAPQSSTSSASNSTQLVSVQGKSGCAACDFGVHPTRDRSELGLAVKAQGGKVYIVEGAHQEYPDIYASRFDGIALKVSGQVIREEGKFVWLEPENVSRVN